jgi:hypothetical protein
MKKLKQIFIFPFLVGIGIALGHAIFALATGQVSPAWWSVIISCGAMLGFMAYLGLAGVTATSRNMPIQVSCAIIGAAIALFDFALPASLYTLLIGCGGTLLYVFWYSDLDRNANAILAIGQSLPDFEFQDEKHLQHNTAH